MKNTCQVFALCKFESFAFTTTLRMNLTGKRIILVISQENFYRSLLKFQKVQKAVYKQTIGKCNKSVSNSENRIVKMRVYHKDIFFLLIYKLKYGIYIKR